MINKIEGKVICTKLDIAKDKVKEELGLLGLSIQYLCLNPREVYHSESGARIVRSWSYSAEVWRK